jgi:hypothetical protein
VLVLSPAVLENIFYFDKYLAKCSVQKHTYSGHYSILSKIITCVQNLIYLCYMRFHENRPNVLGPLNASKHAHTASSIWAGLFSFYCFRKGLSLMFTDVRVSGRFGTFSALCELWGSKIKFLMLLNGHFFLHTHAQTHLNPPCFSKPNIVST